MIKNTTTINNKNAVNIFMSADENYICYAGVLINSIIKNSSLEYNYNIFILEESLSTKSKNLIRNLNKPNVSISFININDFMSDKDFYVSTHVSKATYYRLYAPQLFKDYSKIIYLDVDTIVLSDISNLYNINIDEFDLGAVNDLVMINALDNPLNLKNINKYFNAGILLINLDNIRKNNTQKVVLDLALNNNFRYYDQDALNLYYNNTDKVKLINYSWNCSCKTDGVKKGLNKTKNKLAKEYEEKRLNANIIHYAGGKKPWNELTCDLAVKWWKYAVFTPLFPICLKKYFKYQKEKLNSKFKLINVLINSL